MELLLPHRKVGLDTSLNLKERKVFIDSLLEEEITFHSQTMTVEEYFRYTWNKNNTKTCLDIIGYYLTKVEKDLEILSHTKEKEMKNGSKRHTTFSSMDMESQQDLGLIEKDEKY